MYVLVVVPPAFTAVPALFDMNERAQAASFGPFNGGQPLTLVAQAPGWISLLPAAALHHPAVLCRPAKGTYPVLRLYVCTFVVLSIAVVLAFVNYTAFKGKGYTLESVIPWLTDWGWLPGSRSK